VTSPVVQPVTFVDCVDWYTVTVGLTVIRVNDVDVVNCWLLALGANRARANEESSKIEKQIRDNDGPGKAVSLSLFGSTFIAENRAGR